MNETFPILWGVIAIAALIVLFRWFRKFAEKDIHTLKPAEDIALEEKWMS